ncbi:hypothetical protein V5799_004683, partial [Amblyomma americanum]
RNNPSLWDDGTEEQAAACGGVSARCRQSDTSSLCAGCKSAAGERMTSCNPNR